MQKRSYGVLLASFIILMSNVAYAQFTIGAKAGGNLYDNYQIGTKYFTSEPWAGFHAGVFVDYPSYKKVFGRIEGLFSTRGLNLAEYSSTQRIIYKRESAYLDFPISINYTINHRFHVHAGVVPSVFLFEYRSVTTDEKGLKQEGADDFNSYERFQLGALGGLSYTTEILNKTVEFGARGSMGLTRTNEHIREVRAGRDPKYMMLQAYIGYPIFHQ